jgi:antitoxin YefM
MDQVYNDHDPLIITRKNNQNIVLLSIEEYNSLLETNYLLSSEENYKFIKDSIDQYEKGKVQKRDLIEND